MPLPRFDRLPPATRSAILAVARAHFARDGRQAASFNQIIAAAGISKTSAYHYFDGKDDLYGAVVADAAQRLLTALGPWTDASTVDEFWDRLRAGAAILLAHLRDHPEDRAVLAEGTPAGGDPWIGAFVDNGIGLGIIDPRPDAELVKSVTAGVLGALDDWALAHPDLPDAVVTANLELFLRRIFAAPG